MKQPSKILLNCACCVMFLFACVFQAFARGGGGCFVYDTPIAMADGSSKPIGAVRAGDLLLSCALDGSVVKACVQEIYSLEVDTYLEITVGPVFLKVTPEHPFFIGNGAFRTAASLRRGDTVYSFDGQSLRPARIDRIRKIDGKVTVYNLSAETPNTFLAGGILVHNKGGGCFLKETPILMADGSVKEIGAVRVGDTLLSSSPDGKPATTRVREIFSIDVNEYLEVNVDGLTLNVTEEHPFFVGNGKFKTIGSLKPGDSVYTFDGRSLTQRRIGSIKRIASKAVVYNLSADSPNTFVAGSILVHNKGGGGCFLENTPIMMADGGSKNIKDIKIGDSIRTSTPEGKTVTVGIRNIFSLDADEYLEVGIGETLLRVTAEHPFYVGNGEFKTIGSLSIGDSVYAFDGKALARKRITSLHTIDSKVRVYNLSADSPDTFVADGILVHNKGGGFGGGYHGSYYGGASGAGSQSSNSNDDDMLVFIIICAFITIYFIWAIVEAAAKDSGTRKKTSPLDKIYETSVIVSRAAKVNAILKKISDEDSSFEGNALKNVAKEAFTKLQDAWEKRDYRIMDGLVTSALSSRHEAQLEGLKRSHDINKIDNLKINRVEIIHVRYSPDKNIREFSAIIDAKAHDYYVDDRSHVFLRGDFIATRFQEIYVFRMSVLGPWLLAAIEQTKETRRMRTKNLYEPKGTVTQGTDDASAKFPAMTCIAHTRLERDLDRMARRDPAWNREEMIELASSVFTKVYMHREGDPSILPEAFTPEIAKILATEDESRSRENVMLEYLNFCVRSCYISSFKNGAVQEFTARISAHAQRKTSRQGIIVQADKEIREFVEYWTFRRSGNTWLLVKTGTPKFS